ncbi:uncharacterized protein fam167b isoform 1-T1 [Pholidichthys leucotaenia]
MMDFRAFGEDSSSSEGDSEDLDSVKALTEKLKLQTRRPSYLEWQERIRSRSWAERSDGSAPEDAPPDPAEGSTVPVPAVRNICGFETIDDALEFLRKELGLPSGLTAMQTNLMQCAAYGLTTDRLIPHPFNLCSNAGSCHTSIIKRQPLDMTMSTCTQLLWSTMARPVLSGTCPVKPLYGFGHRAAAQFQGVGNLLIA